MVQGWISLKIEISCTVSCSANGDAKIPAIVAEMYNQLLFGNDCQKLVGEVKIDDWHVS